MGACIAASSLARAQVGVHVGAAKRVDRLLGIADQRQHAGRAAVEEQPPEDLPLGLVGVLELVDQRVAVARAQAPSRARARAAVAVAGCAPPASACPESRRAPPRACAARGARAPAAAGGWSAARRAARTRRRAPAPRGAARRERVPLRGGRRSWWIDASMPSFIRCARPIAAVDALQRRQQRRRTGRARRDRGRDRAQPSAATSARCCRGSRSS